MDSVKHLSLNSSPATSPTSQKEDRETEFFSALPNSLLRKQMQQLNRNSSLPVATAASSPVLPKPVFSQIEERLMGTFSGFTFLGSVEEMNYLVRQWSLDVGNNLDNQKARIDFVLDEINTILKAGMVIMAAKFGGEVNDVAIPSRTADAWQSCYSKICPSLESAFLPLRQNPMYIHNGVKIDIRKLVLTAFRSFVIMPLKTRLIGVFENSFISEVSDLTDMIAKLTQMLTTLASISVEGKTEHQAAMRQILLSIRKNCH